MISNKLKFGIQMQKLINDSKRKNTFSQFLDNKMKVTSTYKWYMLNVCLKLRFFFSTYIR